jgi:hypothetical protein
MKYALGLIVVFNENLFTIVNMTRVVWDGMAKPLEPSLYGLNKNNSNKDFSKPEAWGKNQFNNAFPVALSCYAYVKHIEPVYLTLDNEMKVTKSKISVDGLFGLEPLSENLFFAFESDFTPCRTMAINRLERIDLVTMNTQNMQNTCLRPIEIKLTALPDNATATLSENQYGSEIVVRSPSIIYLALSIARTYEKERSRLRDELGKVYNKSGIDWTEFNEARPFIKELVDAIDAILESKIEGQTPFMLQPIWKTEGKTLHLNDNCFDIFVWSDFAFTRLFIDNISADHEKISRYMRTVVWLSKMLYDYAANGKINFKQIIDTYTYGTKNDKAFATNGNVTNPYMACDELTTPRIGKFELKNIILGGGEKFLSPERRLDAAILASPELFE